MVGSRVSWLLIIFVAVIRSAMGQDQCVKQPNCRCIFSNGTGIDLSPNVVDFLKASFYNDKTVKTFYFHPCGDKQMNNFDPRGNNPTNTCKNPVSICLETITFDDAKNYTVTYEGYGNIDKSNFSTDGASIIYDMSPSSLIVKLACSLNDDRVLSIGSLVNPQQKELIYLSRDSCLKLLEDRSGLSAGAKLLIIFYTIVAMYVILGVCTRKFLMGATGIEVFPNIRFWMGLPGLVKDGCVFITNGFKVPRNFATQSPDHYDSI